MIGFAVKLQSMASLTSNFTAGKVLSGHFNFLKKKVVGRKHWFT